MAGLRVCVRGRLAVSEPVDPEKVRRAWGGGGPREPMVMEGGLVDREERGKGQM